MRRIVVVALVIVSCTAGLIGRAGASSQVGSDDSERSGVRIVNYNILHGLFCAPETEGCQAADRVDLFAQQLEAAQCPEVVGLQEVNQVIADEIDRIQKTVCDGKYEIVFAGKATSSDTERILTTLEVKSTKVLDLVGGFRTASRVVFDTPDGPLVVVTTHQDGDPDEPSLTCQSCKPPCRSDRGIYDCQTDAAVALTLRGGGKKAIRVLMGDFNVDAASARYAHVLEAGFVDSHLEAGNAECVPDTGVNCTSGRDDKSIEALKDPNARESHRIDFIFVKGPAGCELAFDSDADGDGDGVGTGLFFDEPAVDGPGGIVWASDHTATSADISCA
jgi:endonuclease/exonuclease/phosphatase family metal-dependent hydrolase